MTTVVLNTKCKYKGCIGNIIKVINGDVTVQLNNNITVQCKANELVSWGNS